MSTEQPVKVYVPREAHRAAKIAAAQAGITLQEFIERAIHREIGQGKKELARTARS